MTLKFSALKDTACEGISPSGATELAAGAEETFTCTHKLSGRRLLHQRSLDRRQRRHRHQDLQQSHRQSQRRTLLHDRKAAADQRRRQLQHIGEQPGKIGQTVEYKIIVRNTGNVALKFTALKDTGCEGIAPSGRTELAAGAEETFTCTTN